MFLLGTSRKKDGEDYRYCSVVENRRVSGYQAVQRTVLYLGEINDTQQATWRKTLDEFDENNQESQSQIVSRRSVTLLPESIVRRCGQAASNGGGSGLSVTAGWRANCGGPWGNGDWRQPCRPDMSEGQSAKEAAGKLTQDRPESEGRIEKMAGIVQKNLGKREKLIGK